MVYQLRNKEDRASEALKIIDKKKVVKKERLEVCVCVCVCVGVRLCACVWSSLYV